MDLSENGWWVAVPADVVRCPGLSVRARLLHVILMSYRDPKKPQEEVYPRVDTLARMLDCCEKSIGRAMKELEGAKLIERKRRMGRSTLTALKATGYVLPTRLPCPVAPDTHDPAEEEPVKKSHTTYADKPRESLTENPTPTAPKGERVIVPADDTIPYNPLARPKKPLHPKYRVLGKKAVGLWDIHISAKGVGPLLASWSIPTLVKAGKTLAGLKDTPFADRSIEEVFAHLVARLKTCNPLVRKAVNFGWLFCAEDNLARMLAGDWDVGAGEQEAKLDERIIDDVWPG